LETAVGHLGRDASERFAQNPEPSPASTATRPGPSAASAASPVAENPETLPGRDPQTTDERTTEI